MHTTTEFLAYEVHKRMARRIKEGALGSEITTEKQRVSEALARLDAQREKLTSQLSELRGDRACARALQQGHARKKDRLSENEDHDNEGRSRAGKCAADHNRKTG